MERHESNHCKGPESHGYRFHGGLVADSSDELIRPVTERTESGINNGLSGLP